jgi:hypothetical protein
MNIPDPLSEARKHLADAINQTQIAYAAPLMVSPWIAMSCLQKAIRRGHEHLALRAENLDKQILTCACPWALLR